VEKAIAAYEAALTVRTREALPQDWAATQTNLGNAFTDRIRGDRADNLEKAVAAYQGALTVLTLEALPQHWAATQNGLGLAYWSRIRGDRADNMEKAIAAHEAALTVLTREALPREWAETQGNLGLVYWSRVRGDRADNLEKAIAAYEAALTIRTREALPREWAHTQNNLGIAYRERIRGDRAENLDRAVATHEAALTMLTREAFPWEWAATQDSLGSDYEGRIRGDRADNMEKAIAAYEAALTVMTREALPRDHLRTSRLLGAALLDAREWRKAGLAYASARDAFLLLFGQGLNEAEARDLITQAGSLFSEAAYAAAQLGQNEAALALASEGRARLMAVTLKLGRDDRPRVAELRTAIRTAERTAEATQGVGKAAAVEKLVGLRQELLALVRSADAAESQSASSLAQAVAAQGGVVVVPIVTKVGSKALIVTGAGPQAIDLPDLTSDRLDLLVRGKGSGWLAAYPASGLPKRELDKRLARWGNTLDKFIPELWPLFAGKLTAALKERRLKPGARLVWMPSGALGILPLGAAQDPTTQRRLADDYEIVHAPSLDALASAQRPIVSTTPATLAAIVNPTGDLEGTEKEGAIVASHFAEGVRTILQTEQATPSAVLAALRGKSHWHFASHGTFSWQDARKSALIMNSYTPLTVGQLLDTDDLGRLRLVVLSACETGLHDIDRNPDEFVGLPGAFAALGAAGVVSTLWPVDDEASWLLIAKFYDLHMGAQLLTPPTALSHAQAWLRSATTAQLRAYAKAEAARGRLQHRQLAEIERALSEERTPRRRLGGSIAAGAAPTTKRVSPSAPPTRPGRRRVPLCPTPTPTTGPVLSTRGYRRSAPFSSALYRVDQRAKNGRTWHSCPVRCAAAITSAL
jgi:CHAT domain/Tetratricopeptide repeat